MHPFKRICKNFLLFKLMYICIYLHIEDVCQSQADIHISLIRCASADSQSSSSHQNEARVQCSFPLLSAIPYSAQ